MDMVVDNPLKRKINFRLTHEENSYREKRQLFAILAIV